MNIKTQNHTSLLTNRYFLFIFLSTLFLFGCNTEKPSVKYVCTPCNSHCDQKEYEQPGTCKHCGMKLITKTEAEKMKQKQLTTIAFYLQDGVEVLDFAGPMEVFVYAGYRVFTVSKTKSPIISQGTLSIIPDYSIEDAPKADILAFFGGNSSSASNDPEVIDWVKKQSPDYHFSVCTGAFILAEAGVLKDKTATTFHNAISGLIRKFPETNVLSDVRFVDNGEVITTAGVSAGIDGALHLVAKLKGLTTAKLTAYYMEYDKWVPGEGLILAEDNPYINEPKLQLSDYTGTYENKEEDRTIELRIEKDELYAVSKNEKVPVFHAKQDDFISGNRDNVSFQRDENNTVSGFILKDETDLVFTKQ